MSNNKVNKVAIFISAGLGDAVLLVPLIKKLKQDHFHITAIITSPFDCEALFEGTKLFDEKIMVRTKTSKALLLLSKRKHFDITLVNYFAASRSNLALANSISKKVICNNNANRSDRFSKRITFIQPQKNVHDAVQNLLLYYIKDDIAPLTESDFYLEINHTKTIDLPQQFIAIQVSAGNNRAPYKTWLAKYWIELIQKMQVKYPNINLVLLGDKNEISFEENLKIKDEKIISLIGKTSVAQAMQVLSQCSLFVGLDGGLLHMAVSQAKPTFTIWGGSDPELYGYEKINKTKHREIKKTTSCGPCNSWISPNTSKTNDPMKCPDFACLVGLSSEEVFTELTTFIASLKIYAE